MSTTITPLRHLLLTQTRRHFGTRGSTGRGWLYHYRKGQGGRKLQGRWHYRDVEKLRSINDQVFSLNESTSSPSSQAYLDISIGGAQAGRVVIELASRALPQTCKNFRLLCQDMYKDTVVHRVDKDIGVCMGDVLHRNGDIGQCHPDIGVNTFPDEGFYISHTDPGIVSMTSSGVDSNDSRFMITTADAPQLDGKFVAFGRVKSGMEVIENVTGIFTRRGIPTSEIKIVDCGEIAE
mmetsp:Transcript_28750/g.35006  ORF Transcript_28750/g.35006 Transcript_28750/m.35006 type:complete len:236 (-) Transcript_28750:189-896(-)|eukprot:CAMPEP_0172486986 /NCGR_PEP_ID=MMETSP1066-20121228/15804_1 /TAXON_ID=671091 /ORGANISM="Coscinodiscus wailesii, Strain CCMP2513" /LENGTH=235 /DNA_ID=CAMNT_0013253297 /DNA_START=151 /DNA_END=858 /DNA_ORIENTATION=+